MKMDTEESFYGKRIWIAEEKNAETEPELVCFRGTFQMPKEGSLTLKISADTRFKLYVNGVFAAEGPCKPNIGNWYFDMHVLTGLKKEENLLAAEVLRSPEDFAQRNHSLLRRGLPFLTVEAETALGEAIDISWKCRKRTDIHFVTEKTVPAPIHMIEETKAQKEWTGWYLTDFSEEGWEEPSEYPFERMKLSDTPRTLKKSPIPVQKHTPHVFSGLPERISADSEWSGVFDAGELMTAYPILSLSGGEGSEIRFLYAESYYRTDEKGNFFKEDRTDSENGVLIGNEDLYQVCGNGREAGKECYEPFWFRTFRFVKVTIRTKAELFLHGFEYLETGYPLEKKCVPHTSEEGLNRVWDMSFRTLKRCMHETYEDCPFYEQLQYAMDSRSEILFTYYVSGDDRMARRCMEDFRCSMNSEGMINSCAPALRAHVIPGFSIFYILMVYDHMMFWGDRKLVKKHFPAAEGILDFFEEHCGENGLVEKIGGPNQTQDYWSFIDWTRQWNTTAGMPTAGLSGPITMESLLYLAGLEAAQMLAGFMERKDQAEQMKKQAEELKRAIRENCLSKEGLLLDGPGAKDCSVHCQVFGVLTDVLTYAEGQKALRETVGDERYAQCSVAMNYYLFRALEKAGLYEMTAPLWKKWYDMLDRHLTTCVENDTDGRSDCHAWGALALYEIPAVILGIRPAAPGWKEAVICPHLDYVKEVQGAVRTPLGEIRCRAVRNDSGKTEIFSEIPEGIRVGGSETD